MKAAEVDFHEGKAERGVSESRDSRNYYLPSGNPAAMSRDEDVGRWFCALPFRAVCPLLTYGT